VAKRKDGSYVADDRRSSWVKIKNPNYSQLEGREELFERISARRRRLRGYSTT